MSDYLQGFLYGRMLAQNPQLMQMFMHQQKVQQEQEQTKQLGDALLQALGSPPTESAQVPDQQSIEPTSSSIDSVPYADLIAQAAQSTGLSPEEIASTIKHESNFNPNAVSPTGPQGLMQLSKAAALDVGLNPDDRLDPAKNIMAGSQYLKRMKDEFGDNYRLAYHDGPGAVRSGNISQAGLDYASKFSNDPFLNIKAEYGVQPLQGGSKFLPNPVKGGSGLLGQDMDPVRRSYLQFIRQLVDSHNPMAIEMAAKLMENMQDSSLKDIERTATQKDISWTNLAPGTQQFSDTMLRTMMKPANQTVINTGEVRQPISPMTDEQMAQFGLPTGPGHTKYVVDKNGMPQPVEARTGTEDQGKSATFAKMANEAHRVINDTYDKVDYTKLGIKHAIEQFPVVGEFISGQYANPELSAEDQLFDNSKANFVAAINRRESGATVTPYEWAQANYRFIPGKGDKPEVIAQKNKNREVATRMMMESGGILGQSQLEQFDKSIQEAEKAIPMKNKKETHTWVDDGELPPIPKGYRLAE